MPKTTVVTATISASGPLSFCSGGSVTLTANSGSQYLWSPGGQTTRSITVSNAGSYTVRVTNSSGVNATSSPAVVSITTTGSTPTVTANGSTSFCAGGSVVLTSSSASSYLWSNGATTQSITVTSSGNYSVTTRPNCSAISATKTVTMLTAPTKPSITANGSLSLSSSHTSVTLTSTTANAYAWSSGSTTRSVVVNTQGSYRVTVTGSNGCKNTSTAAIVSANGCTPPAVPVISLSGSNVITSGSTVTLTSTTAGGYLWSTGATTRSITVSAAGTYSVRGYNAGGCFSTSLPTTIVVVAVREANNTVDEITTPSVEKSTYTISLLDIQGRVVYTKAFESEVGLNHIEMNVSEYQKGIYFGYLTSATEKRSIKVIID